MGPLYSTRSATALLLALVPCLVAADINHLRPPLDARGGLAFDGPTPLAPWQVSTSLRLGEAVRPLVARYPDGSYDPIIGHQIRLDAAVALGVLPLCDVGVALPVLGQLDGTAGLLAATGFGVGDLLISVRLNPLPAVVYGAGLAVILQLGLPTGSAALQAQDGVSFRPAVVASVPAGPATVGLAATYWLHPVTQLDDTRLGDEFGLQAGVRVPLGLPNPCGPLTARLEGAVGTTVVRAFTAGGTFAEALAGISCRTHHLWDFTVGGAVGLSRGVGTPAGRAFLEVAFRPDAPDRDGDGIADTADACPDQPEDRDGVADYDGCPDLDPTVPSDRDDDGVPDGRDVCPDQPEDHDGVADTDGCPDPDNDHDGVADPNDQCPNQPETINGIDDTDGCPDVGDADVEYRPGESIGLKKTVQFDTGRSTLVATSFKVLDQVALLLLAHTEITRVRIEGHTDSTGRAEANLLLSQQRAEVVGTYLVERGVAPTRLIAQGFGQSQPIDRNDTPEGRAHNRRVAFIIVPP